MVSIPNNQIKNILYYDISKQLKKEKQKTDRLYPKNSILKSAENDGYFTYLSTALLNDKFNENKENETDAEDINALISIYVVNLVNYNIKGLACLEYCLSLVYLDLSQNFISDISPLQLCCNLQCLNISNNLIERIPGPNFWQNMDKLNILYLDDNPIAVPDYVTGLQLLSTLQVLTLRNCPLSFRKRYRHFIVNSIWTLKVLDNYLVSDEEIIEDSNFQTSTFRSLSKDLKFSPYFVTRSSSKENVQSEIRQFISLVNVKYAKASPVLIIQKFIRGFLCRQRFKKLRPNKMNRFNDGSAKAEKEEAIIHEDNKGETLNEKSIEEINENAVKENDKKILKIDLQQLNEQSTLEALDKEARYMDSLAPPGRLLLTYRSVTRSDNDKCSSEHIYRAINKNSPFSAKNYSADNLESLESTEFRLKGIKPPKSKHPVSELIVERNRIHYSVKEADRLYHEKKQEEAAAAATAAAHKPTTTLPSIRKTNYEILKHRIEASSAIYAARKAMLSESEFVRNELYADKLERTMAIQHEKEIMRRNTEEARSERVLGARLAEDEHRRYVLSAVEREKENFLKFYDNLQAKKSKNVEVRNKISDQFKFSLEFRSKQTGTVTEVNRNEKVALNEHIQKTVKDKVNDRRTQLQHTSDVVQAYMDTQAEYKRTLRRIDRAEINGKLVQNASSAISEAKTRVERLKSIHRYTTCPALFTIQPQLP